MKKSVLVTGSTDGIGKLVAIQLAKEGHEIYLHGRNSDKLTTVISEIKVQTKNNKIKGFVADFSNLDDVKKMANQIKQELSKLDVLINNVGVYKSTISQNSDGLDMRFVVNYLAPVLLTNRLMNVLKKGEKPRLINLSSAAQSSIDYEVLTGVKKSSASTTYAQSKLALTIWSFYLAKQELNINVIAVNPGSLLNTNMVKEAFGNYWSSADKGADILYELAVSDDYQDASGKYFDNDQGTFAQAHPDAYNEKEINKIIATTAQFFAD